MIARTVHRRIFPLLLLGQLAACEGAFEVPEDTTQRGDVPQPASPTIAMDAAAREPTEIEPVSAPAASSSSDPGPRGGSSMEPAEPPVGWCDPWPSRPLLPACEERFAEVSWAHEGATEIWEASCIAGTRVICDRGVRFWSDLFVQTAGGDLRLVFEDFDNVRSATGTLHRPDGAVWEFSEAQVEDAAFTDESGYLALRVTLSGGSAPAGTLSVIYRTDCLNVMICLW